MINMEASYTCEDRWVIDFDAEGLLISDSIDLDISGKRPISDRSEIYAGNALASPGLSRTP